MEKSDRHGTSPYIFSFFFMERNNEITKNRTIKGSEAKEFTPDETHSDDIRLAFHLRFHHKVSEQIIKIDTSRMIDYSFIDTNFENLKSLIVTED